MTLLVTALLISPLAPLAAHARCRVAAHPCAPAPVLLACCCILVADAEQPSSTVGVVLDYQSAAGGPEAGPRVWMPTCIAFEHPTIPAPSPPSDRFALLGQLLI